MTPSPSPSVRIVSGHLLSRSTFLNQIWYGSASLLDEVSYGKIDVLSSRSRSQQKIGLLFSKSRSQQRFKMLMDVYPENIS